MRDSATSWASTEPDESSELPYRMNHIPCTFSRRMSDRAVPSLMNVMMIAAVESSNSTRNLWFAINLLYAVGAVPAILRDLIVTAVAFVSFVRASRFMARDTVNDRGLTLRAGYGEFALLPERVRGPVKSSRV
jgi:hypothetical protein